MCVCCLNLVINYVLQKSFRHIEFQRSLIMMMSCIMDVDVDTGIYTAPAAAPPTPPVEGRFRCSPRLICGYRADAATGKPERVRVEILAIALQCN